MSARTHHWHRRSPSLSLVLFVLLALFTLRSRCEAGLILYTQISQHSSMQVEATAYAPDVQDKDFDSRDDLGSFDRSIIASAGADPPAPSFSVFASHRQIVAYGPGFISASLTAEARTEQTGAHAGQGAAEGWWEIQFRVRDAANLPFRLSGQLRGVFDASKEYLGRHAGGEVVLYDLDTPDADGGTYVICGVGISTGGRFVCRFDYSGELLAGHRYKLTARADATRNLLNDPADPGPIRRSALSLADLALVVPEPSSLSLAFCALILLARRHHS